MTVTITGGITFSGGGLTFAPSGAAANDPYFMYNSLLLPGNGTNLAQNNTFLDGSTNNFTITRAGNTTQGTFSPYGANWSNYFDGTGDYLTTPNNSALNVGSSTFTLECWFYNQQNLLSGAEAGVGTIASKSDYNGSNTNGYSLFCYDGNNSTPSTSLYLFLNGISFSLQTSANAVPFNTWTHVAVVKSGTTLTIYCNGVSVATSSSAPATINDTSTVFTIGSQIMGTTWNGIYPLSGYVSNLRLVKGTAVYTSAFTPSTTPLTAITNTSLLTCQSNRFIDNSTNAFAITVNGNTNIQRFSPFSPSTAYDTSTIGGSGYFDGSGDYLSVANNSAFNLNGVSFTVECWVYWNNVTGEQNIAEQFTGPSGPGWTLYKFPSNLASGTIDFYGGSSSINSGVTPVAGQWYHLAVSRNNSTGTTSFYVNGTRTSTATFGVASSASTALLVGVRAGGSTWMNGYIEDLRIVRGSYVYDPTATTITIPSAPLTAVANTQLLLGFTNAGITDSAMINNLETVGDAKISTTQSKFGGSSMAFDGTGDYLSTYNPSYSLSVGSGDFTYECWLYVNSLPGTVTAVYHLKNDAALATTVFVLEITPTGAISISTGLAIIANGTSGKITTGSWIHFAFVRTSGVFKTFFNGTQDISTSNTTAYNGTYLQIGAFRYTAYDFSLNGYIDDLRITKGYARYTSNFTPPTQAFPTY